MASAVQVSATTRNADRIKKNLRSQFPSNFCLNPLPDTLVDDHVDNILKRKEVSSLRENNENNANNGDTGDNRDQKNNTNSDYIEVRKSILKVANNLSVEGGSGVSVIILKTIIDQVRSRSTDALAVT